MKTRRLIFFLLMLTLVLGVALAVRRIVPDPIYRGKHVSAWVSELNVADHDIQEEAREAIRELGPAAVPMLSRNIQVTGRGRYIGARETLASLASHLPRQTYLSIRRKLGFTGSWFAGSGAAIALGEMGPDARDAIPALLEALDNESDLNIRSCAACALIRIAPDDARVISALGMKLFRDKQWWILGNVSNEFEKLNSTNTAVIPLLRQTLLTITNSYARMNAARALGEFGSERARIVTDLTNALVDPDLYVRIGALQGLGKLGFAVTNGPAILMKALGSPGESLNYVAARVLSESYPGLKEAVPALTRLLSAQSQWTRLYAAKAIWRITGQKETVLPIVTEVAQDNAPGLWWSSAVLLADMGVEAETVVPLLVKRIVSGAPDPRDEIAALVKLGPAARLALPQLKAALQADNVDARLAAAEALWKIDPQPGELLPLLRKWLQTGGVYTKTRTAEILGEMGPAAKDVAPLLIPLLQDKSLQVRRASAEALKQIAPATAMNTAPRPTSKP